ncbi:MAG: RNA polymerase sigma factor [Waltera sp.]
MEKLVKKAKKGDAEAFIALMEQNRQIMIRIAFAYLGNEEDVADAMQETILSAFEKSGYLTKS